jgi:hypothetical protein
VRRLVLFLLVGCDGLLEHADQHDASLDASGRFALLAYYPLDVDTNDYSGNAFDAVGNDLTPTVGVSGTRARFAAL